MAKHKDNATPSSGKMTIMLIQLEGNDETLQEGIRTFKEAMGRAMPQIVSRTYLPSSSSGTLPAPPAEINGAGHNTGEIREVVGEAQEIDTPAVSPSAPKKPSKDRKFPTMEFVKDLNLYPTGKPSLKAFVAEKKPANQLEKITVCLYYLCRSLELKMVTANHVFTCLRDIGARTPNDLPQEIRNIAKRKGFIDATSGDDLKITNPGDNFVVHSLPGSNGKS